MSTGNTPNKDRGRPRLSITVDRANLTWLTESFIPEHGKRFMGPKGPNVSSAIDRIISAYRELYELQRGK